ncbi:MAG: Ig-like domain-containing protein [Treponema sp.]|nr:Ig-like domain-containing protein [Treponema sp.]
MKTKKIILVTFVAAVFAGCFGFFGCKDKNQSTPAGGAKTDSSGSKVSSTPKKEVPYQKVEVGLDDGNRASYDQMTAYFNPDFSYIVPEDKSEAKKKTGSGVSASNEKSESVIPSVRKLNEYKTEYSTKRAELPTVTYEEADDIEYDGPFEIEDWGPQDVIIAEEEHPTFYVIFSQPVKALSALDAPSNKSDVMTIEPALKGVFRWYGSRHLSFECDEAADPTVEYKITINKSLKSLGGVQLSGENEFKTRAEEIKIVNLFGGYIKNSDQAYGWDTGALPAYANRIYIRLNCQVTEERLKQVLKIQGGDKLMNYTVQADYDKTHFRWYNQFKADEEKKTSNSFIVTITDEVPYGIFISATTNGVWSQYHAYYTLKPLVVDYVPETAQLSEGEKKYPFTITFNQKLDKESIYKNVSFNFDVKLSAKNCTIEGNRVTFFNLPVEAGNDYTITLGKDICDVYGQKISDASQLKYNFSIPSLTNSSYVKYIDSGAKMMEAQFPHKILFEYQNIEPNSYYEVLPTLNPFNLENPLYQNYKNISANEAAGRGLSPLDNTIRNGRRFEEIDLEPYLKNGRGFVKFSAAVNTKDWDYWNEEYETRTHANTMTVQVTDLGITARMGINKAVVMVRSLSTGKPVADADVYVFLKEAQVFGGGAEGFAQGKTDENGLAVITYTENQIIQYENSIQNYWQDNLYLMVKKDDDRAVYNPNTHNNWAFDVDSGSRSKARVPDQRTFMFVDRGIYKPGETVTFRGIDRDQVLGSINAHKGNYSISVKGDWWQATDIISPLSGTLSESGGFYGSFKLPDDLEPGTYRIQYYRGYNGSEESRAITFTVANFERLKIESSITSPDITYYGGDKLSAEVSADYLAGGSLSGADYEVSWYKQETSFSPETPETKDYTFGPEDYSYGRTYYSDGKGKLNSNGKASLSCTSEKITTGNPCVYRVECAVTDISNQRVSSAAGITVHPSLFYAGLRKPAALRGFAKKDQKLEFSYILVDTEGNQLDASAISKNVRELSYTLNHDEWTMVHEQSVDDTIYTRYEKQTVEDAKGSVKAAVSGTITVTPAKSGWHTLTLKGKDKKGNAICTEYGFYVTGGDTSWYDRNNSEGINLTPDQSQYNPGDTAQLLLESPLPAGDYLITVEREGIFTEEIRHFDSSANVIEVPISNVYVPVVYVSVASYSERHGAPTHQYGEPDLDKPKGYFGVAPIFVNPYVRAFSVQIESDKNVYKPGETATLTLTATKGGKPFEGAELTVMAVDRGVIDLINYHVPNPIDFFYNRYNFPLCVKGGDSRAMLMDPVTYSVKNLAGGDADEEKEDERKDFRPTALFEPVIVTGKDGKATCTFKMPDNLTTYRLTAFGVKDDLFALQEDEVKVQNPINIQAVQPRRLRERDTAECGVLITNLDKASQKVTVSIEARRPTKNTAQDELEGRITVPGSAFVDGKTEYTVTVASGGSSVVYFDVAATEEGTVELVYSIKSDVLNEKLVSPIKIEKTFVYETVATLGSTDDSANAKATEAFAIPGFAKEGRGDLSITLDATRLGMLGSSVNYLFDYPYGCLEQQSSRVLPLVIFEDYIDVFGLDSKVKDIHKLVTTYAKSWAKCQFDNGSFPYWPDSLYASDYVTLRIAHVCAVALKNGYKAEELGIDLNKLCHYLASNSTAYSRDYGDYMTAYTAYVLSLFNHREAPAILNKLYLKKADLTLSASAYMALAYENLYDNASRERAAEIEKGIRAYLQPSGREVTVSNKSRNGFMWWYESDCDMLSIILQAFVMQNPNDEMVDRLLFTLLKNQSHGYWKNTATTSHVLEAIHRYIKERDLDNTNYTATASVDGKKVMTEKFQGAGAKPKTLKLPFEDEVISSLQKDKAIPLTFEKDGTGRLYYTVEMKYAIPDEMQAARDAGLKLKYEITDAETGEIVNANVKDNPVLNLKAGKMYKATIQLESYRDRDYVALRAPIPSGAEILDSTFVTTGSEGGIETSGGWRHWLSNKYIMDNEIQFFWDDFRSGSTSVTFTFRAARHGIYPVPPVQAECMYEPEIFGRTDGCLAVIE